MSPLNSCVVSPRTGIENMDGHAILSGQPNSYARPWTGCITIDQLTEDNLPPFYVRLQDDQVGHLASWVIDQVGHLPTWSTVHRASITRTKLGQFWPWDFDLHGRISPRRDSWGPEYIGDPEIREQGLGGGKKVISWTDPGLPLTYTSSHKIMTAELDAVDMRAAAKRKAEHEAARNVRMPVKRPRRGSMSAELQKMKEAAEMKGRSTETEKDRYPSGNPEFRHAMQIVDAQMRRATEAQNQLETMVMTNEAQYIKDTDEMFNKWRTYNQAQRTKARRVFEVCRAKIKTRGTKIGTLQAEVERSKSLIERQKQKLKARDARLATARRCWAQQRVILERKYGEIQEAARDVEVIQRVARDIDEHLRVKFGSSVWDDSGSDYGAEAEEEEDAEETVSEEEKDEAEETGTEEQVEESAIDDDDDEDDDASEATLTDEQLPEQPTETPLAPITVHIITRRKTERFTTPTLRVRFSGAALYDKLIGFRVQEYIRSMEANDHGEEGEGGGGGGASESEQMKPLNLSETRPIFPTFVD